MIPDQFLVFAQVFPEPLMLVTSTGEILAVNQHAARLFDKTSKTLIGQHLTEFVTDSPEKVIDYLRVCSQSRQMILGALTIHQAQGEGIACRSQGAVIQPRSHQSPAINLLRIEKRMSNGFVVLNQKIHALSKEIQQRQQIQVELARSNETLRETLIKLQNALETVQAEKMSGLVQLVAGIAHEINNPISFIYGNLTHAREYYNDLLKLIQLYQQEYPNPSLVIQKEIKALDLDFLQDDIKQLLQSMETGSERISDIVIALRNFSRLDEATFKVVDIHEGLEATLMILQSRLNKCDREASPYSASRMKTAHRTHQKENRHFSIEVIKEYGELPGVYCSASQINQVLMNLLNNAIDALEEAEQVRSRSVSVQRFAHENRAADAPEGESPEQVQNYPSRIWIRTEKLSDRCITIHIKDNGGGIPTQIHHQIFNPFFTTKPVGKGTGLGLSISYQIIESHGGQINVISDPSWGTEFSIELPICK